MFLLDIESPPHLTIYSSPNFGKPGVVMPLQEIRKLINSFKFLQDSFNTHRWVTQSINFSSNQNDCAKISEIKGKAKTV